MFTFKCAECGKRYFFKDPINDICAICNDKKLQDEQIKQEARKQKIAERRKKADEEANKRLKEELNKPKIKPKNKPRIKAKTPVIIEEKKETKIKSLSLEQQAEQESQNYESLLYIYADVKRIKAIEWKNGKKRVALNKEREIRRTHKGGFSQEKFQRFVDSQKKKTWQWIEDNLTRKGVLRPPYEHLIVECKDSLLEKRIHTLISDH